MAVVGVRTLESWPEGQDEPFMRCCYGLQDGSFCGQSVNPYARPQFRPTYRVPLCPRHEHDLEIAVHDQQRKERSAWVDKTDDLRIQNEIRARQKSAVYYVRRPDGAIKIGFSTNLRLRLQTLGSVVPVELLATHVGDRDTERAMHRQFAASRLHGEWFTPSDKLLAHIERVRALQVERTPA